MGPLAHRLPIVGPAPSLGRMREIPEGTQYHPFEGAAFGFWNAEHGDER